MLPPDDPDVLPPELLEEPDGGSGRPTAPGGGPPLDVLPEVPEDPEVLLPEDPEVLLPEDPDGGSGKPTAPGGGPPELVLAPVLHLRPGLHSELSMQDAPSSPGRGF